MLLTDEETGLCDCILKHLARSESLSRLHALLRLVRTFPEMLLPHTSLDADPFLLNLRNGTLDLRTSELLPHNPDHYLTHLLPYDYTPDATSPLWDSFLDRLTNSDSALQFYLQRAIGSALFENFSDGEHPVSASRFGARALASGLVRTRHSSGRFYHGFNLLPPITPSSPLEEDDLPIAV